MALSALSALAALAGVPSVSAQAGADTSAPDLTPVYVAPDVPLDREALRAQLANASTLRWTVVDAPPLTGQRAVLVVREGERAHVRYVGHTAAELQRTIPLSPDARLAGEAVALVIINLVEDQTSELLSALTPQPTRDTESAADTSGSSPVAAANTTHPGPPPSDASPPSTGSGDNEDEDQGEDELAALPMTGEDDRVSPGPVAADPGAPPPPHPCTERARGSRVGVDLLPGVGSSSMRAGRDAVRGFSLNLAGGLARGLHGFELGGGFNVLTGFACGLQVAGGLNVVLGPVRGVQLAPVNIATGRVEGAQLGVVNVAGEVRGLQLGLVNISKDAAAPIGLVSVVRNGRTSIDAWGSESGMLVVNLTHGGRLVHNLYGVGARVGPRGPRLLVFTGLGVRLVSTRHAQLDLDALLGWMLRGSQNRQSMLVTVRLPVEVRLPGRVGLFIAPSYQWLHTEDAREHPQAPPALVTTLRDGGGKRVLGWPGLHLGVRLHLGPP
ncbi:MAG: hypothetical protein KC668_05585 [Myxococcales bacterium]|nr:hypothetical protein [Myxococcales bacterium]